jgi:hypothetical protein
MSAQCPNNPKGENKSVRAEVRKNGSGASIAANVRWQYYKLKVKSN